jgi:hypothetical protein
VAVLASYVKQSSPGLNRNQAHFNAIEFTMAKNRDAESL